MICFPWAAMGFLRLLTLTADHFLFLGEAIQGPHLTNECLTGNASNDGGFMGGHWKQRSWYEILNHPTPNLIFLETSWILFLAPLFCASSCSRSFNQVLICTTSWIHVDFFFLLIPWFIFQSISSFSVANWDVNHWNGPEGQQTNLGKTPIFVRDVIYVISHGPEFGTSWNLHVLQDFNSLICWSDVNIWPVWPVWNQRITNEWSQLGQGSPTKTGMADTQGSYLDG